MGGWLWERGCRINGQSQKLSENNGKTRKSYEKVENVHYLPYLLKIHNFHTEHQLLENY